MCDNHDDIPVKDVSEAHRTKSLVMDKDRGLRRDEIHDRILQLTDENVFLKKHARKFEEKAKHLEAKLNRILSEKKFSTRKDEIEAEENKHRIIELEYQVGMLKDRLQVAKQQLASYTQLFPIHAKLKPKPAKAHGSSSTTTTGGVDSAVPNSELAEQFEVLLLEAKTENQALENQVKNLRHQIHSLERELSTTKELLRIKEVTYEDELNILRGQLGDAEETKRKLADNIQLIRVQRDSRRATSWLSTLEARCKTLESSLSAAQENNQQLEAQLNAAQEELRESQQQNLNFQKQVEESLAEISRVKELEAQINSLQEENAILKETNESLQVKLAAAGEKFREVETEGASLKTQISSMEVRLKKELQSKTDLYSEVSREKSRAQSLQETLLELQSKFSAMEVELKRMEQASLTAVSSTKITLAETVRIPVTTISSDVLVNTPAPGQSKVPVQVEESETQVEVEAKEEDAALSSCEYCKTLEKDLTETRTTMGKLQDDLIKTKNLLKNQMATNRECHKEIEVLSEKLEKADRFHHEKLQEFMKVLEERALQMQTLEQNLEAIKSQSRINLSTTDAGIQVEQLPHAPLDTPPKNGTASVPAKPPSPSPVATPADQDSDVSRSPQSVISPPPVEEKPSVEIFIHKFIPHEGQKDLVRMNLFATWELNEATQYTPIVREGVFNSSSTHLINSQRLKVPIPVQIHQAVGSSDCKTLGSGTLHPGANSCLIKSVDNSQNIIGELNYELKIKGVSVDYEASHGDHPLDAVDSTEKTGSTPPEPVQVTFQSQPVVPKPKPRRLPTQAEMEVYSSLTETSEVEERSKNGREKSKRKKSEAMKYIKQCLSPKTEKSSHVEKQVSPKKPILRRDSTSPEVKKRLVKKVTVREVVEERRIPSSSDEDKSEKVTSVTEKTLVLTGSSSETSGKGSQLNLAPPSDDFLDAPKIITVQNIESTEESSVRTPKGTGAATTTTATSTTEQEQSSGSAEDTSQQPSTVSKTRRKRSRKSGRNSSASSSLDLSENDSSSQDSEAYKQAVRIEISYIIFNSPSRIWGDPNVKRIFIEYRFLDFDPEELETPSSIPKPQPGKKGEFNFVKVFQIDTKERRRLLLTMLQEKKRIRFTVVSEPSENDTLDCEDIGYAYVPIVSLLKEDLVQELIPVYDAENPRSEMGSICVSIQARQALKSL